MSTHCSCKQVEELSALAVGEDEPLQGLTSGELIDPPSTSVDPQQSSEVFAKEHPATPGQDSPWGIISSSDSGHNLGGAPEESDCVSPDEGGRLHKEYAEFINLKDNAEIVLLEAMEATKQLNTVFNHIRTSMNRMSPMMKKLFIVSMPKASKKTIEPGIAP
ncbi:hypothetical protein M422DRAFT_274999 [Sphaerobolus stellatus SS14]|uniref:Uncharacterized protein n=1 Tax=Sphaerobolus stellatus (strain SS14) TaxID=990650 RepID=A0A0C9TQS7_SPHS4|nr:hypothetical protein M422DRAFT_274999 [Sphaerobolus stellatus SS14]